MTTAMLLGAGQGGRLAPLTSFLPKPLVPVGLRPLLDRHLDALAALGVDSVAINASHLADRIDEHLRKRGRRAPRVELLREATPLDTGGGLLGARSMLEGQECFLVINADVLHGVALDDVLAFHRRSGAGATLVVRRAGRGEEEGYLTFDDRGGLAAVGGDRGGASWTFTGIHVLTPRVFDYLSSPGSLGAAYEGLLRDGVAVASYDGSDALWFDIGTPASYLAANRACARTEGSPQSGPAEYRRRDPVLVADSAEIGTGCTIGPNAVIGERASIGPDAQVSDSVVWPDTSVPAKTALDHCIVHPGGTLAVPR